MMKLVSLSALLALSPSVFPAVSDETLKIKAHNFVKALEDDDYSIITPPDSIGDVKVAFFITSIDDIHESTFVVDAQLYMNWEDDRLEAKDPAVANKDPALHLTTITGSQVLSSIWIPPLYFQNARSSTNPAVLLPNQIVWVYSDGTIEYISRVILTISCIQKLHSFPFDAQNCEIVILSMSDDGHGRAQWNETSTPPSFSLTTPNDLLKSSQRGAVFIAESQLSQAEYTITGWSEESFTNHVQIEDESFNKTGLIMKLSMKRKWTQYVSKAYLPTVLLVGISWLSFKVDQTAIPARVTLTITTVLTLQTIATNVEDTLPKVSYWKSLDAWFTVSQIFVFAALLEFVFTHSIASTKGQKGLNKARQIDRRVALVFLPLYTAFCLVYFIVMATREA